MKNRIGVAFAMLISLSSVAQKIIWSSLIIQDKKVGMFDNLSGVNDKYIFTTSSKKEGQMFITAFDKSTLKKTSNIEFFNLKSGDYKERVPSGFHYNDKGIQVFYDQIDKSKKISKAKVFANVYSTTFDKTMKMKQVFEYDDQVKRNMFLKYRNTYQKSYNNKEEVLFSSELPSEKNQNLSFSYRLLDKNFDELAKGKFQLDLQKLSGFSTSGTSVYLLDDSRILTFSVAYDSENQGLLKGKKSRKSGIINIINPTTTESVTVKLSSPDKSLFDYQILEDNNGQLIITGFFAETKIGNRDYISADGIFYATIQDLLKGEAFVKFIKFDKKTISKINAASKSKRAAKKNDKMGEIDMNLDIIEVFVDNNKDLFIVGENIETYLVSTTDSKGRSRDSHYIVERNDVYLFKVTSNYEVDWISVNEREFERRYSLTDVSRFDNDVATVVKSGMVNLIYSSTFKTDQDKADKKNKKLTNVDITLKHTKVDIKTGDTKTKPIAQNTDKADAKILLSENIVLFGDEIYGFQNKAKRKIGMTILGCATLPCLFGSKILASRWNKVGNYSIAKVSLD